MIRTTHHLNIPALVLVASALTGCSSKPGDSDIQAALAAVYDCPILELRDVKKLNGEPGPDGGYEVAVSYTVAIKGGEVGAQKLLTDWVFLDQEARVADRAAYDAKRQFGAADPRVAALESYSAKTFERWTKVIPCEGDELRAISAPLYERAAPVLRAGPGTAALPVGVHVVRTGLMSKSENGWRFRHFAPDFNKFDVLESRALAIAMPPSQVPNVLGANAAKADERTLTGVIHKGATDSCLAVVAEGGEKCYALPGEPDQAKAIFSACGDGTTCAVTGQWDEKGESLRALTKAEAR